MTTPWPSANDNLSGMWQGLYSYSDGYSVPFVATLLQIGESLSGTIDEPRSDGGPSDQRMVAKVDGTRNGAMLNFTKRYDGTNASYDRPVLYEGNVNADATEIDGRWTIERYSSGRFLMTRAGARREAVTRKLLAPIDTDR